jgi:hypothetical protein
LRAAKGLVRPLPPRRDISRCDISRSPRPYDRPTLDRRPPKPLQGFARRGGGRGLHRARPQELRRRRGRAATQDRSRPPRRNSRTWLLGPGGAGIRPRRGVGAQRLPTDQPLRRRRVPSSVGTLIPFGIVGEPGGPRMAPHQLLRCASNATTRLFSGARLAELCAQMPDRQPPRV